MLRILLLCSLRTQKLATGCWCSLSLCNMHIKTCTLNRLQTLKCSHSDTVFPTLICRLSKLMGLGKAWVCMFVLTSAGCQKVPLTGARLAHVLPAAPAIRAADSLTAHWGTATWKLACNHLSPRSPLITSEVTRACVWFAVRRGRRTENKKNFQTPINHAGEKYGEN